MKYFSIIFLLFLTFSCEESSSEGSSDELFKGDHLFMSDNSQMRIYGVNKSNGEITDTLDIQESSMGKSGRIRTIFAHPTNGELFGIINVSSDTMEIVKIMTSNGETEHVNLIVTNSGGEGSKKKGYSYNLKFRTAFFHNGNMYGMTPLEQGEVKIYEIGDGDARIVKNFGNVTGIGNSVFYQDDLSLGLLFYGEDSLFRNTDEIGGGLTKGGVQWKNHTLELKIESDGSSASIGEPLDLGINRETNEYLSIVWDSQEQVFFLGDDYEEFWSVDLNKNHTERNPLTDTNYRSLAISYIY